MSFLFSDRDYTTFPTLEPCPIPPDAVDHFRLLALTVEAFDRGIRSREDITPFTRRQRRWLDSCREELAGLEHEELRAVARLLGVS